MKDKDVNIDSEVPWFQRRGNNERYGLDSKPSVDEQGSPKTKTYTNIPSFPQHKKKTTTNKKPIPSVTELISEEGKTL